jgi:hypothetical protein
MSGVSAGVSFTVVVVVPDRAGIVCFRRSERCAVAEETVGTGGLETWFATDSGCWHDWVGVSNAEEVCQNCGEVRHDPSKPVKEPREDGGDGG